MVRGLVQIGEMVQLLVDVVKTAVRHPTGYWGDVREQLYLILVQCWAPMLISTVGFGFSTPGLQGTNLFLLFGIPDRLGSFFLMASVREFAPWINAMVVAGVVGTAIAADLGARRVREELDAMEVLGVDPVRDVILPRVIAMTLMTGLIDIPALVFGVIGGWMAACLVGGASTGAFLTNFWNNATTMDMAGSVLKTTIFGLILAIVCCYKGYRAEGGPSGVGKAVNQAVIMSFAAIWLFNYAFTALLLELFPSIEVYR
jgi:phospholipid/cholesterol/gamma-HCH transport system permease protein